MHVGPRLVLSVLVGFLFVGAAGSQDVEDVYRLQLFSMPESHVVSVGEEWRFEVQGVAAPRDEEALNELVIALRRMAFPGEINANFQVVEASTPTVRRTADSNIIEFYRHFTLKATRTGRLIIPAVVVPLDGSEARTRPREIRAYRENEDLARAHQNVVPVVAEGRVGRRELRRIGSGFLIADDALVTAYHVVIGSDRVRIRLPNGRSVTTNKAWAIDPVRDVAVLRIDPETMTDAGLSPLQLSPDFSTGFRTLEEDGVAFTAGWPNGIQQITSGVLYRGLQFEAGDFLSVSSNPVRPGDSGGPLLNERGEVLGVVSSGRSNTRERDLLPENVSLATDPRRALAVRIARSEPLSLRDALEEAEHDAPNGEVLHLSSTLAMAGETDRSTNIELAQIASAAQRAPDDASLQFLAGSVFQSMGDATRAEVSYQASLDGHSDYFPAMYALGQLHYQRGRFSEAERFFERTRSFAPYARLGSLGLARVLTAQLRYEEAEEALWEVLDREPTYGPALFLLGYVHLAQDRIEEAQSLAVRLDRVAPAWAVALRFQIETPMLHPAVVVQLPRAEIPTNRIEGF